ncbi:glycosyltransferase family 2 protein [Deinococcus sp. QL22]|uniref:glycosyltransferase family 2 protein n=1 Tax=Deinococcus sp. QL22 TaxID=2939437 RepID=UPI002017B7D5|nr:glycosyltransferase family 2 protein [Deinococcus sp. QL22]UQN09565.1 glycosyltransferase [Deinococcus sp. QL22]
MRTYDLQITVVIATYNRFDLLKRALNSVRRQVIPVYEVIVVDDCSTDETSNIRKYYPEVKLLKQSENGGPGPARNLGIMAASGNFVLILDDDDELVVDCTSVVYRRLSDITNLDRFPVVQFAHSNGRLTNFERFKLVKLEDYWSGAITGDFQPLINVKQFKDLELSYPDNRIGGENLLWWHIADDYGIPTWYDTIGLVNDDATLRLTSVISQIRHSKQHLALAIQTLSIFGSKMEIQNPKMFHSRLLAVFVYAKLSGDEDSMHRSMVDLRRTASPPVFSILRILSIVPLKLFTILFTAYRRAER